MRSRVLVVAHDPLIREHVLDHCNKFGLNAYAVTTAEESVALAEYFDLVLMDIELPGISGIEATREIRRKEMEEELACVPVVAMTSSQDKGMCLSAGMNDYLSKPVSRAEVFRILDQWLFRQAHKLRCLG